MRNITNVTVGADPEFFLFDTKTENYVSAHDMLPGTKEEPFRVEYGAVQVDGTAVEFNIDPADNAPHFIRNVNNVIKQIRAMVPERFMFAYESAVHYKRDYFAKLPAKAVELGCNPDYNGYTFKYNPIPNPGTSPMRTGAGHVHVGWEVDGEAFKIDTIDEQHILDCGRLARNLDITLGIPSLEFDRDFRRRRLYGKAGAYRPKTYGMEYRTLGNFWLRDDAYMAFVFDGAVEGVRDYWTNGPNCKFMQQRLDAVQRQINGDN
jgi:hypothetical protein